jgi:hypothetical protein
MKNLVKTLMLAIGLIVLVSFIIYTPKDKPKKFLSIEKAIKEKLVEASFSGLGGYQGECMELNITSLMPKDTIIRIEPGRRLVAQDSTLQDILIVKEIQLFLASGETKQVNLFGFCCQATDHAPGRSDAFDVGFMMDSSFILLSEFLGNTNLPLNVMQSAIWVLSNNHSINSISNENENDRPKMKELYQLIAKIKKIKYEFPWYSLKYKPDTAQLFSNRPVKMIGEFEYTISNPSNVDLVIRTPQNKFVKNIFVNRPHNPDNYTYRFTFDVSAMSKGKYFMILYVDNQQKIKKEFEL